MSRNEVGLALLFFHSFEILAVSALIASGVKKFARLKTGTLAMWIPLWIPRQWFPFVIFAASAGEVALGTTMITALVAGFVTAFATATMFAVYTAYGVMAIRETGACGCDGGAQVSKREDRSVQLLFVRNLLWCAILLIAASSSQYGIPKLRVGDARSLYFSAQLASLVCLLSPFTRAMSSRNHQAQSLVQESLWT